MHLGLSFHCVCQDGRHAKRNWMLNCSAGVRSDADGTRAKVVEGDKELDVPVEQSR